MEMRLERCCEVRVHSDFSDCDGHLLQVRSTSQVWEWAG